MLKELNLNTDIKKSFKTVLNNLLEKSNFLFNREYIISELIPLWDNDKNDVCEYMKFRNWRRFGNNRIEYKEFLPFLNNDKKIYSTRNFLVKLEPLFKRKILYKA